MHLFESKHQTLCFTQHELCNTAALAGVVAVTGSYVIAGGLSLHGNMYTLLDTFSQNGYFVSLIKRQRLTE